MSKVALIKLAKKIKNKVNVLTGVNNVPYVSYTRRINFLKTTARVCAMTFDDGPVNIHPLGTDIKSPLTLHLIKTLEKHSAHGTFDVIGTTENNYPDKEGKLGTPSWGGIKFDHYPCFDKDKNAGAVNCPELIDRMIKGGHEIANHTYAHILYGKKNIIYSRRNTFNSFGEVHDDLLKLHDLILENHGYKMSFSRPPHYVDKIINGVDAYDLLALEDYQYLGASFDGAGWLPRNTYEDEISAMTEPLKEILKSDADSMCGKIIFQKDGCNMSLRTPVAEALDLQLEILDNYGYNVIGVGEMFEKYPFSDVDEYDEDFDKLKELQKNHAIVYSDNFLRLSASMTVGELAMLIAPKKEAVDKRIEALLTETKKIGPLPSRHPYSGAVKWATDNGCLKNITVSTVNRKLNIEDFSDLYELFDIDILKTEGFSRRAVLRAFKI